MEGKPYESVLNRGNCRWLVHLNGIIFLNLNEICNMKHYYLLSKLHKLSNVIAGYLFIQCYAS